jgi:NADH-quinone oxidoreductase subunit A
VEHYVPILLFVLIGATFPAIAIYAAAILRHRVSPETDRQPYECGNEATTFALDHRFSLRYYLIAVLFVVFDVETVFLYPWAVTFDKLGLLGFIEMTLFLVILVIGYVYVWRKGALSWA